eukprot:9009810-Alexandrium_andersonii.AAC.1
MITLHCTQPGGEEGIPSETFPPPPPLHRGIGFAATSLPAALDRGLGNAVDSVFGPSAQWLGAAAGHA